MQNDVTRSAILTARCRRREKEIVKAAARSRGIYMSELIREATLRAARHELLDEKEEPVDEGELALT